MVKVDRRVRRTQRLLQEALVNLVLEKGYEAVTIKEITERADVAYATFFRHYRHINELLMQVLSDSLSELQDRIEATALASTGDDGGKMEGKLIFSHVEEHARLYRILLSSQAASRIKKLTRDKLAAKFLESCPPLSENPGLGGGEIAANHIASSLLALIEWWLENERPHSVEEMAEIYSRLILSATLSAIEADAISEVGAIP